MKNKSKNIKTPKTQQQQLNLFKSPKTEHGGSLNKGKRKTIRPLDSKRPVHIVLRSNKARGTLSLIHKKAAIKALLNRFAEKNFVKIHQLANVGNHLHIVVSFPHRSYFARFLKTITGRIAVLMTGAKKGEKKGKFWDELAYTRVVNWGRDFIQTAEYITKNLFEGEGVTLLTVNGFRHFQILRGKLIGSG